jgi:hypothetical protein
MVFSCRLRFRVAWRCDCLHARAQNPTPQAFAKPGVKVHRQEICPRLRNLSFNQKCRQNRIGNLEAIRAERFEVKGNGALHILERGFFRVALPNDHTVHAERVGNETVRVLFNYDFECASHGGNCSRWLEGVCWVFGCGIPEPSNPLLEGEDDRRSNCARDVEESVKLEFGL